MDSFDAIIKRDINCLYKLLKKENVAYQLENDGLTPLHFAVTYEVKEAVVLLLAFGADRFKLDEKGISPFEQVMHSKSGDIFYIFEEFTEIHGHKLV